MHNTTGTRVVLAFVLSLITAVAFAVESDPLDTLIPAPAAERRVDASVADLIYYIRDVASDQRHLNLHVNWPALGAAGVDKATPVAGWWQGKLTARQVIERLELQSNLDQKAPRIAHDSSRSIVYVSTPADVRRWLALERARETAKLDAADLEMVRKRIPHFETRNGPPLREVVESLAKTSGAQIRVDWATVAPAGSDERATNDGDGKDHFCMIDLQDVTLADLLDLIVTMPAIDKQLAWRVEKGVVTIYAEPKAAGEEKQ